MRAALPGLAIAGSILLLAAFGRTAPDLAGAAATDPLVDWMAAGHEQRFASNDLYGHINGGAELFLEFGFAELVVRRFTRGEAGLDVEIYQMTGPAAALGIYLLKCGDETPVPGVTARNTGNRFQITAVQGPVFAQINNFGGDADLMPVMIALAERELAPWPQAEPLVIWNVLPREGLVPGSERLIRGPFAMQPVVTLGEGDILQLGGKVFGVLGDYTDPAGEVFTRIVIPYPDSGAAVAAFDHLQKSLDPYLTVVARAPDGFVYQDYRQKYGQVDLEDHVLSIAIGLAKHPVNERPTIERPIIQQPR